MPMSLRIPIQKENLIEKAAIKEKNRRQHLSLRQLMKSWDWSKTEKMNCVISRAGSPAKKQKNCGAQ